MADENMKMMAEMKQLASYARSPAEVKPLTSVESVALDIARYRNHLQAVSDLDRDLRTLTDRIKELDKQREAMIAQSLSMRDGIVLFAAEAREQVGVLMRKHGLTQEEINGLAKVPDAMAYTKLAYMVPARVRDAIEANEAQPAAES